MHAIFRGLHGDQDRHETRLRRSGYRKRLEEVPEGMTDNCSQELNFKIKGAIKSTRCEKPGENKARREKAKIRPYEPAKSRSASDTTEPDASWRKLYKQEVPKDNAFSAAVS